MNQRMTDKLLAILREVGAYQLSYFRSIPLGSGDSKLGSEMVSEIDIESERRLHAALTDLIPESTFYGEETVQQQGGAYNWVVDPLDGTANYLSGYDAWSISVALVSPERIEAGFVYKPFTGEYFHARSGQGAWYMEQPLPKHSPLTLAESLLGTGFPYRSAYSSRAMFDSLEELLFSCRGIRRSGSAALDLCFLAAGFLQGFWEIDLQPYDAAAGLLMLEETGCRWSDFFGSSYKLFSTNSLVAGLPGVYEELQPVIEKHYRRIEA